MTPSTWLEMPSSPSHLHFPHPPSSASFQIMSLQPSSALRVQLLVSGSSPSDSIVWRQLQYHAELWLGTPYLVLFIPVCSGTGEAYESGVLAGSLPAPGLRLTAGVTPQALHDGEDSSTRHYLCLCSPSRKLRCLL